MLRSGYREVKYQILILNTIILAAPNQYGYFTIYYNYAQYLSKEFRVIYVCFDQGEIKLIESENINVIYLSLEGNKFLRFIRYYQAIVRQYNSNLPAIIILKYYFFCSLLNLIIPRKNLILDIRTGYISEVRLKTFFFNLIIRTESFFSERIITLSESLRKKLKLRINKTTIIPLGADQTDSLPKEFNKLVLLYVGTLISRNIHQTVEGLSQFVKNERGNMEIKYHIVGGGNPAEIKKLNDTIARFNLNDIVYYEGPVYGEALQKFLVNCNIGISYIPLIKDYDCQPATKTIEYLMAGMPVIATNTYENSLMINNYNGVLINDTPEDFCSGLVNIFNQRNSFNSFNIRKSVEVYTWGNIVNTKLKPILFKYLK
jgi:glycosyltransferase involved in cell wall biosynthesis